jgi:hypothetical protein
MEGALALMNSPEVMIFLYLAFFFICFCTCRISDSVHMALMAGVGLNIAGIGLVGFLAKAAMIGVGGVLSGGMQGVKELP